jgi:hypothetical protein
MDSAIARQRHQTGGEGLPRATLVARAPELRSRPARYHLSPTIWWCPMTAVRSTNRAKLAKYRAKRDFTQTGERSGEKARKTFGRSYLIQKHAAHVSIMTSVSNWVES